MLTLLWITTIVSIIITIYVGLRLYKKPGTSFDIAIRDFALHLKSPFLRSWMQIITRLGNVETLFIIIVPILFVLIRDREYTTATAIIVAAGLSILVSQAFKLIFRRTRPSKFNRINHIGYSFPSGHSTVGVAFYTTIAYIISSNTSNVVLMVMIGFLVGLLIAVSRIYLGVHWASDVLVGIMLGIVCAFWAIYLFRTGYRLEWLFGEGGLFLRG